ncbi:MAG: RecB family exonuclease [Micromonosporaceae bacterium]
MAEQLGFEGMPQKLFVGTPSKLLAYEDCPRRYRYSYVDRPAPQKGPPWAHNSLGASVHTALRNWYALPVGKRTVERARVLLKATWVSEGYRDDAQERAAFERALGWLEAYLARCDPADEPLGVERTVAAKTRTLALSGRVDRVDRRGEEVVIVDYKTGRAELTDDDARGSRALALYAYAAEKTLRRPCREVELHHLPTESVARHRHTDESLARHLRRAEEAVADIRAAERAVADGKDPDVAFPAAPGPQCGWCDFRQHCAAGTEVPARQPWAALPG